MDSNFIYFNRDHKFIIKEWLDGGKILGLTHFKNYSEMEDVGRILEHGLRACSDNVAPTNDDGDTIGAMFKDGRVTVPISFHKSYWFMQ